MKFIWLQVRKPLQVKSFNFEPAFYSKFFVGKQCCKVIYYSKSENKTFEHEFQITKKVGYVLQKTYHD